MLKLDDKDKNAKSSVLQEIMDLMDHHSSGKLSGLKKPAVAEMSVTALKPKDEDEPGDDSPAGMLSGDDDGDEPSEEDKAKIAELYQRYCK